MRFIIDFEVRVDDLDLCRIVEFKGLVTCV